MKVNVILIIVSYSLHLPNNSATTTIKQIHMLFRHGERSPTNLYPTDPYKKNLWPDGLGYLTNRGKLQMFNLGKQIRYKYKSFIPTYYFPGDVEVQSSYSDRCLMSVQLFNAGLFFPKYEQVWNPKLLWQPIPVYYKPRNEDNMITSKQNCSKYDKIYEDLFNFPKFKQILEDHKVLFNYLTKHTGKSIDTFREVEELYNTLEIEQFHNLTLPNWTNNIFPTSMKHLAALSLSSFTETEYMKRMKAGPILKKITDDMKQSLINENSPKLFLYSGHDLTLVNILRALGYREEVKPGFGAYLIFELHSNTSVNVKILYNLYGEEKELPLKNCEDPCSLQHFENVLKPMLPENWIKECNL